MITVNETKNHMKCNYDDLILKIHIMFIEVFIIFHIVIRDQCQCCVEGIHSPAVRTHTIIHSKHHQNIVIGDNVTKIW